MTCRLANTYVLSVGKFGVHRWYGISSVYNGTYVSRTFNSNNTDDNS